MSETIQLLSQAPCWNECTCVCMLTQWCPALCNSMNCSPSGSSVHRIFQARILEWVAISSSSGSFQPRDQIHISCICRWILYYWTTWEAWNECDSANFFSSSCHSAENSCFREMEPNWCRLGLVSVAWLGRVEPLTDSSTMGGRELLSQKNWVNGNLE